MRVKLNVEGSLAVKHAKMVNFCCAPGCSNRSTRDKHVVRFIMYFCSKFMEISKSAYFWKAYSIRNLKTNVYICTDARMAAILDFQNGCRNFFVADISTSNLHRKFI